MRGDDATFIDALAQGAFAEYARAPGPGTLWMAEHQRTFIATVKGRSAGFAIVDLGRRPHPELSAIAVVSEQRGRGVGSALLLAAERTVQRRGLRCLVAHTADANLAALDLLLRHGYQIRRRLPRYYVEMYDACEVVKRW